MPPEVAGQVTRVARRRDAGVNQSKPGDISTAVTKLFNVQFVERLKPPTAQRLMQRQTLTEVTVIARRRGGETVKVICLDNEIPQLVEWNIAGSNVN